MKTIIIIFALVLSSSLLAKSNIPKFEMGKIQYNDNNNCSYYMKPISHLSFEKRAQGLKKFVTNAECFMSIVNFMKTIDNEQTQVYVNNLFVELENYSKEKRNVAKAMVKFKKPIVELMIENLLDVYNQDFHKGELSVKDLAIHKDKIEEFFQLRKDIAMIVVIMTDNYPALMRNYKEEIAKGLKHPEYKNADGDEVFDSSIYRREINNYLQMALDKTQ